MRTGRAGGASPVECLTRPRSCASTACATTSRHAVGGSSTRRAASAGRASGSRAKDATRNTAALAVVLHEPLRRQRSPRRTVSPASATPASSARMRRRSDARVIAPRRACDGSRRLCASSRHARLGRLPAHVPAVHPSLRGNRVNFRFDFKRSPVALSSLRPRITAEGNVKLDNALANGCDCGSETATLRRRRLAHVVAVYLQCDGCGGAIGSALSRKDHFLWQDYPEWDLTLRPIYDKARDDHYEQMLDQLFPTFDYTQRSADYAEWCRTSPEWHALSGRVLWRSRGWCEACLVAQASVVHHKTYAFGKLPPAWHLRAVCTACHDRLHNADDEWCDYGMGRNDADPNEHV